MNTNQETYSFLQVGGCYLPICWNPVVYFNASALYPTNAEYKGGVEFLTNANSEGSQPIKTYPSQLSINPNEPDQENLENKPLSN